MLVRPHTFFLRMPAGAAPGCGNGKYLQANPDCFFLGSDRSLPLLCSSSLGRGQEAFACDALTLPLRAGQCDAAICVAVLHHFSTEAHRLQVVREVCRILRVGGRAALHVWAQEQEAGSKRTFDAQDVMVPWQLRVI